MCKKEDNNYLKVELYVFRYVWFQKRGLLHMLVARDCVFILPFFTLHMLHTFHSDFSQLLSKPKYSSVEKIKTIGSTYMAAAGLQPGRNKKRVSVYN